MGQSWEPEFGPKDYRIIAEQPLYSGYCSIKRYSLAYKLFDGGMSHSIERELISRPPAAAVLLFDPKQDALIMIEQLRVGALNDPRGPWLLEIVAGLIDAGESPEETAKREAMEEAGCEISSLKLICQYWVSPGISNEKTHVFCGITRAEKSGRGFGLIHDGEDIKVHIMPSKDVLSLLHAGKITNASTVIALQWFELNHATLLNLFQ